MRTQISFLFPGQGTQYVGMGKSFYEQYNLARETFEEAEEILQQHLSNIIFHGPIHSLTETKTAQPAIFVTSIAILRCLQRHAGLPTPTCVAGLSLGEYTALVAANYLPFSTALTLIQQRAELMHEACEQHPGKMIAILKLSDDQVKELVASLNISQDLWCANFNCPGQVVLSGTPKGIAIAEEAARNAGARVVALQTHGAFHSGLMQSAQENLTPTIQAISLQETDVAIAMNTLGRFALNLEEIKQSLTHQMTSSVLWHQSIQSCLETPITSFIEIGCGKTLTTMNKRIGSSVPTISIETVDDIAQLEPLF